MTNPEACDDQIIFVEVLLLFHLIFRLFIFFSSFSPLQRLYIDWLRKDSKETSPVSVIDLVYKHLL